MPFTLPLHAKAPDFKLVATDGLQYSLSDLLQDKPKGVVIFFTCNHCPYVIGSDEETRKLAEKYSQIKFIAINSNSANTVALDSYEEMQKRMAKEHFPWVYLHDVTQEVAKAYGALRTPHFYLFNQNLQLVYTGQAVDSPKKVELIKERFLEKAITSYLKGEKILTPLTNPIGCNVKWEGKDPHFMPEEACDLINLN